MIIKLESNINNFENIDLLQAKIKYSFKDVRYLKTALAHTSYVNENKKLRLQSNERQEFLGDAVLSLVVSDYLFRHYSHLPEGELTRLRAALVCEKTLSQFASEISLGDFLVLGKGEGRAGGRKKSSILADAFESLIAAIYLDSNLKLAAVFIMRFVKNYLEKKEEDAFIDYKTMLQEIVQQNPGEKLSYNLIGEFGPDHDKQFVIELLLNNNSISQGKAHSKKEAEQLAAKEALLLMGIKDFDI